MMKTKLLIISTMLLVFAGMTAAQDVENDQMNISIGSVSTHAGSGIRIKFVKVSEDSRCPDGANCIWAGNAKIQIETSVGEAESVTHELNTNGTPTSVEICGYTIQLMALTPYPHVDKAVKESDYRATFAIKATD